MKAPAFLYACPRSLPEAFELLARHGEGAKVLAGGQSLMATLNMRLSTPEILVDINRIDGLAGITVADGFLRIGAMTRHFDVEHSPLVARHAPLIAQAMPHVAHPAIRNRGTFGGSLAFADPAAELPACVVALDARLVLESARGRRSVEAKDFFRGLYSTALAADELLVAAEIPVAKPGARQQFSELARRHGDYALIGVAATATTSAVKLVFFAAGDRPIAITAASAEAALAAVERDLEPPEDFNASAEMRLHLAKVMTREVLGRLKV
jgi:carbon-monoxide dehydrogenase medium subunit